MYGIKNCDTIKRARAWLDVHNVAYSFHDFKTAGVQRGQLEAWCRAHGWEVILNRAGTTFKTLGDADKRSLTERKAIALMLEQPSMIKRPLLQIGNRSIVGFSPERYSELFAGVQR
jgi:arsenate reductase